MKRILTVAFTLASSILFGQRSLHPSQFDKFISSPSVEWAAYVNDKIRFKEESLNKWLFNRLLKNEIKASTPVYFDLIDADNITYLAKDSIDDLVLSPVYIMPRYDSNGNAPVIKREDLIYHVNVDSLIFTDITQILYIENGELKSYVPWVAPMRPVKTSMGVYLGDGDYFSTCFNFKHNYRPGKRSKTIFLSQIKRKINFDSTANTTNIKKLYSRNLAETLWPYISSGKIEVISTETNTRLNKEELNAYLLKLTRIPVPAYDSTGTVSGFILPQLDFSPEEFSDIELVQDWYYNHTDNIVFNKIKALYLYAKKPVADEEEHESVPVLKIVFN